MPNLVEIRERVKKVIVTTLELPMSPADIGDTAMLFAPALVGGLDLDSLAAIEILVGLSKEFGLNFDEIPREAFLTPTALSEYIAKRIEGSADDSSQPR